MRTLVVADDDEAATLAALRRELEALDPRVPIFDQGLISEHLDVMLFPARMAAVLLVRSCSLRTKPLVHHIE